jgi:hypothetical protein
MGFESMMRREAVRLALGSVAEAIAVDRRPRWRVVTRRDHLQNGVAALLDVCSEVAWRPGSVALFLATGERVQAELRYGLGELRQALAPPARTSWRTQRVLLVGVPAAAAALGILARARMESKPADPARE